MDSVLKKFLPIIQSQYARVLPEDMITFEDGHDHYVFLLPNGIAFRFPRNEGYGLKDAVENVFLQDFAKQSPVPVQVFTSYTEHELNISYQRYKFIQGERFSIDLASSFSTEDRLIIAKQLGVFLKTLHAYPIEKARAMHMDELDPKGYYEFFEQIWPENRKTIYSLLTKEEQIWCDQLFTNFMETRELSFIPVVTHNDMLPEHFIVNAKEHTLSGIIDFALRISDPARDFMFFHRYGDDFLEAALTIYGEVDPTFRQRRKFYGGNFKVMYLYNAFSTKDESLISMHKEALSRYIAETI